MTTIKASIMKANRQTKKTKKAIKEAVLTLMTSTDIAKITIKEISDLADINRKTFYAHYTNVYSVLDEIENDMIEKLTSIIDDDDIEKIMTNPYDFFHQLTKVINEDLNFHKLFTNTITLNTLLEKIKLVIKEKFICFHTDQLNLDHTKLNIMYEFIASGIVASYKEWLKSDRTISLEELSKQISLVVTKGVDALKNNPLY